MYIEAFESILRVTEITKYRDCQYRLRTWIRYLETIRCSTGKRLILKSVNIVHNVLSMIRNIVFGRYNVVQIKIWYKVQRDLQTRGIEDLCFSLTNIVGKKIHERDLHIANIIVLIEKQYTCYCQCSGKSLTFTQLEHKIMEIYRSEKYNGKWENKVKKHEMIWALYVGKATSTTSQNFQSNNVIEYIKQYIEQM